MFIEPMLASPSKMALEHYESVEHTFWAEPKLDGIRVIVSVKDGVPAIFSRRGLDLTPNFREIASYFVGGFDATYDGEVVAGAKPVQVRDTGAENVFPFSKFEHVQGIAGSLPEKAEEKSLIFRPQLFLFDMLGYNGFDIKDMNLVTRNYALCQSNIPFYLHDDTENPVHIMPIIPDSFSEIYERYTGFGGEGLVLKDGSSKYYPGKRSRSWFKYKVENTYDLFVTGFEPGKGKYTGTVGSLELSAYLDDVAVPVANCSGMTDEVRDMFFDRLTDGSYIGVVVEVKANGLVGSGEYRTPRHPQFVRIRQDKVASDCSMEQFRA
jgi:bifunctional non-homologous end joining protein LigD